MLPSQHISPLTSYISVYSCNTLSLISTPPYAHGCGDIQRHELLSCHSTGKEWLSSQAASNYQWLLSPEWVPRRTSLIHAGIFTSLILHASCTGNHNCCEPLCNSHVFPKGSYSLSAPSSEMPPEPWERIGTDVPSTAEHSIILSPLNSYESLH